MPLNLFGGKKDPTSKMDPRVTEKYDVQSVLGRGAFSEVWKAQEKKTGQMVAIKVIDRKSLKGKEEALQNEVAVLRRASHPNIVKMFEEFEDKTRVYLVIELVTGGELFDRIVDKGSYTEKDASDLVRQILEAVGYLHSIDVCHRDLKPENLLYFSPDEDSKIMISDFGLSKMGADVDQMATACGTPGYVAPEVLRRQKYGKPVDCWSIGVISYILLCGYPPFYDESDAHLFKQIMRGDYEFDSPYWDDISASAKEFISHYLQIDPGKRFTCSEGLAHPWISGGTAKTTDIHTTVCEQMKKNAARLNWKKAMNVVHAIKKMRMLTFEHGSDSESSPNASPSSKRKVAESATAGAQSN